jgi:hypothetical protein
MTHSTHGAGDEDIRATNVTDQERDFLRQHRDELSESTLRAKWIHSADETEDRPGQTLATQNHDVIKHWAEERGARPAEVAGTEREDRPGVLRFRFRDDSSDRLQDVTWDEWFKSFDRRQLVFVFQQHTSDGRQSNFFRLDSPEREDA